MFGPRNDEVRSSAMRALRAKAHTLFEAADDDVVIVNELTCTEPGCPPIVTIVAHLRVGSEPRQVKIHKPVVEVAEEDLRHAMLR